MRGRAAFIAFLIVLAAGAAGAAPTRPVYRIDSATAWVVHRQLVVTAWGAVRTGGWTAPQLRLRGGYAPEAGTLDVDLVATPPHRGHAVAQATLPVEATLTTRLPRTGVVRVKIVSETNSVIAAIKPYAASATTLLRPVRLAR